MKAQDVISLIRKTAKLVGVDDALAVAIAGHETNCDPDKTRYEAKWSYFYLPIVYADKNGISLETEKVMQSVSWGAMQVMGAVCRELGYEGQIPLLVQPELGVLFGCRKLKSLCDKYPIEADVISAYNGGSPIKNVGGEYRNSKYVNDVQNRLAALKT